MKRRALYARKQTPILKIKVTFMKKNFADFRIIFIRQIWLIINNL